MAPPSHKKSEAIVKQFQISVRIELTVFGVRIFSSSLWAVNPSVIAQNSNVTALDEISLFHFKNSRIHIPLTANRFKKPGCITFFAKEVPLMNPSLQKLKTCDLVDGVMKLVGDERRIGIHILEHLEELERRKGYSEYGCSSLFVFCVKKLKYSEPQASLRISAMWAMKECPEIKPNIEAGKLTVTTVAQVQTHLRRKKLQGNPVSKDEKLALFETIEDQSAKEVQNTLLEINGEAPKLKLTLELDPELEEAWTSVKNLSAHSTQGQSEKILQMLIRNWLKKNDPSKPVKVKTPQRKPTSKQSKTPPSQPKIIVGQSATSVNGEALRQLPNNGESDKKNEDKNANTIHSIPGSSHSLTRSSPRAISIQVRRTIWARDHGQCRLCKSRFAIQIDHIQPVAKGGTNDPHNLRLLCRNCNLQQGMRRFGLEKMRRL